MTHEKNSLVQGVIVALVATSLGLMLSLAAKADLVNQYTFNDGTANDSIRGMHGTVVDPGGTAVFGAGILDFSANNGENSNQDWATATSGAYLDLPNSTVPEALWLTFEPVISFEIWVTVATNRTWAEIFCFGTSDGGEDISGGASASAYLPLIPQSGSGVLRLSHRVATGVEPVEPSIDGTSALSPGIKHHLVAVYDGTDTTASPTGTMYLYLDGQPVGSQILHPDLDLINMSYENSWLGRSQWPDPLFDGSYDEFRIYNHALTAQEVADNYAEGPVAPQGPTLTVDRATGAMRLNNSSTPVQVVGYSITSAVGALDPDGWTSIAGNYDAPPSGDGSFDPVNTWNVGSAIAYVLSEATTGIQGGTLGATPVNLSVPGGAWIQYPLEDLVMKLSLSDSSTVPVFVQYIGNGGKRFERSDLNFDGVIDAGDWPAFRDHHDTDLAGLSLAQAYGCGDLDGDGDNDVVDFRLFKSDFEAANGPGSFDAMLAGVPEPASMALFAIFAVLLVGAKMWRRGLLFFSLIVAGSILGFCLSGPVANADLVHQYTFNDGMANDSVGSAHGTLVDPLSQAVYTLGGLVDFTATTGQGSNAVPFEGCYIDLPNGIISTAASSGTNGAVSFEIWVAVQENRYWAELFAFGTSDGGEDIANGGANQQYIIMVPLNGRTAGLSLNTHVPGVENEIPPADSAVPLQTGKEVHLVGVYDQYNTTAGPGGTMTLYRNGVLEGQGPMTEGIDLTTFTNDNNWLGRSMWPDAVLDGAYNEFRIYDHPLTQQEVTANFAAGPERPALLGLEVDKATGQITLQNHSATLSLDFDYYRITSAAGALDPADGTGWNSLDDQDFQASGPGEGESWDESGGSDQYKLSELYLDGYSTLASGASVSLGNAYDMSVFGGNDGDLEFLFSLTNGEILYGNVVYVGTPAEDADFDNDGDVDGSDFLVWQRGFGAAGGPDDGDANGDGLVNEADLAILKIQFGTGGAPGRASATSVPEPASVFLILLLALGVRLAGRMLS